MKNKKVIIYLLIFVLVTGLCIFLYKLDSDNSKKEDSNDSKVDNGIVLNPVEAIQLEQRNARDSQRRSHLQSIQIVLEENYTDTSEYPSESEFPELIKSELSAYFEGNELIKETNFCYYLNDNGIYTIGVDLEAEGYFFVGDDEDNCLSNNFIF